MAHMRKAALLIALLLLLALLAPSKGFAAEVSPVAQSEIAHLLDYMEKSGCRFYRNGTWYTDAKAVRGHVDMKYRYFMERNRIGSAEDFIKWAASKSEISGKPYLVQCNNGAEMLLSRWLTDELVRNRKERASGPVRQSPSGTAGSAGS